MKLWSRTRNYVTSAALTLTQAITSVVKHVHRFRAPATVGRRRKNGGPRAPIVLGSRCLLLWWAKYNPNRGFAAVYPLTAAVAGQSKQLTLALIVRTLTLARELNPYLENPRNPYPVIKQDKLKKKTSTFPFRLRLYLERVQ